MGGSDRYLTNRSTRAVRDTPTASANSAIVHGWPTRPCNSARLLLTMASRAPASQPVWCSGSPATMSAQRRARREAVRLTCSSTARTRRRARREIGETKSFFANDAYLVTFDFNGNLVLRI